MAQGYARIDSRLDTAKIGSAGRVEVHRVRLLAVIGVRKTFPHGLGRSWNNVNLLTSVCSKISYPYLIKQRGSIMWTRYEFVSYSFLVVVTVTGLGLLSTLFFG